jgi:hypothetical protein
MTDSQERACGYALNSFHSTIYFADDMNRELAGYGVRDSMAVYLAGRAAPLGTVSAGAVTAMFNAFAPELVARHLPAVWSQVTPDQAVSLRLLAADRVLARLLGESVLASAELAEAAELAMTAALAAERPGRPMYSANLDLPVPGPEHLRLWYASTLLREYRGDAHLIALGYVELDGLDALVSHCASPDGMPKAVVMAKRGWTEADWSASEQRLRDRGLMDRAGALTSAGLRCRAEIEQETDRLSRAPYQRLGAANVARLHELVQKLVDRAAGSEAFPAELRAFFAPASGASLPVSA